MFSSFSTTVFDLVIGNRILFPFSQCRNGTFAAAILKHLPQIWSELPAFALYGNELTFLTLNILQLHPKGPIVESLVNQLMQLLLNQLNAVAEHPRRDIYKSLIVGHSFTYIW